MKNIKSKIIVLLNCEKETKDVIRQIIDKWRKVNMPVML